MAASGGHAAGRDERRVSMRDVALRAGVSGQTVSRVVNGSPRVDPATRARVEAAMAELGYRPHRAARALRTGRTHTIGLVVSTLATVGNSRMLQAVADAAAQRGYALTVVTAADAARPDMRSRRKAVLVGPRVHRPTCPSPRTGEDTRRKTGPALPAQKSRRAAETLNP